MDSDHPDGGGDAPVPGPGDTPEVLLITLRHGSSRGAGVPRHHLDSPLTSDDVARDRLARPWVDRQPVVPGGFVPACPFRDRQGGHPSIRQEHTQLRWERQPR